jgi:hypothetical protein
MAEMGPQKHRFKVMTGKTKGKYYPKVFSTRPFSENCQTHFRSSLWFLAAGIVNT